MLIEPRRRPSVRVLALITALALALGTAVGLPVAAPAVATPTTAAGDDAAGLRAKLESASRGYLDAQAALEKSKQRQAGLTREITDLERQIDEIEADTNEIVVGAYRVGAVSALSVLIHSESNELFLDRIAVLGAVTMYHDRQIQRYAEARHRLAGDRAAVADEIAGQQRRLEEMARRKRDAEQALASVGGGEATAGFPGPSGGASGEPAAVAPAAPAPRRADGGWPAEPCSADDPTTSGCLTPRTLHALRQVRAAGFTRTVSCFRGGSFGEHPKGRACDFAVAASGYGGVATGEDRAYGDRLAGYCVGNAAALGVLYVIWFRQIWMPSTGWRAYASGGDPASDHTNHVHLSVV